MAVRASKYDPLRDFLRRRGDPEIVLSLEEIEDILGFELNATAAGANWWVNARSAAGRTQRRAWADADYDAFFLAKERAVRFRAKPAVEAGTPKPAR